MKSGFLLAAAMIFLIGATSYGQEVVKDVGKDAAHTTAKAAEKIAPSVNGLIRDRRRSLGRKAYHAPVTSGTMQRSIPSSDA